MKTAFLNLKVSAKLVVSFFLLALITFAVGGLGIVNIYRLQAMDNDLYQYQTLPLLELRVINGAFEQNRAYMRDLILEKDPAKVKDYMTAIDANRDKIDRSLDTFSKSLMTEEEKLQFTYLVNVLENFDYHREQVVQLCRNGNRTFAYTVLSKDGPKLSSNFSTAMDKLSEIKKQTGREVEASNRDRAGTAARQMGAFVLIAGALAVVLGIAISRLISSPLAAVSNGANEIAKGNLVFQIPEKYRTANDEIGKLGMAFNDMTENIRHLIQKVYESAELVASSSEELNASAANTAQVVSQVASTVDTTAEGARTQVNALAGTMSAAEQMAEGIQKISSNSANVTEVADKAAEAALLGGKKIQTVVAKMTDIKKSVEHSAGVVGDLASRSNEIGQIVSTISQIADQTNLLALNAAIEAARAGDEGRGFAVVAQEVRKLAEQSQLAAEQIAGLIHSTQVDTGKAMTAMDEGTREVQAGYEAVNEAGETFADIAGLAQTVSEEIRQMSVAVESMAAGSRHIVDSVGEVEKISRQTSRQAQTVSEGTKEQAAAMEEIASSCDMLAQLADQLQQEVSRFKV